MTRHLAVAALLASFMATAAHAGVETQTGTVPDSTTDYTQAFTVTGGADSSTFAGFDASLGTLTSVAVTFSVDGHETGTLTNAGAAGQTFKFFSDSNVAAIDAGSNSPTALTNYLSTGLTLAEQVHSYTLASHASTSILPVPNGFGSGVLTENTLFTGAAAAQFIGSNFALDLTTFSTSTFAGGGGNIVTSLNTLDGGQLSIVYNYTPLGMVPEPSAIAAFAAGLLGLTFVRLRKQV